VNFSYDIFSWTSWTIQSFFQISTVYAAANVRLLYKLQRCNFLIRTFTLIYGKVVRKQVSIYTYRDALGYLHAISVIKQTSTLQKVYWATLGGICVVSIYIPMTGKFQTNQITHKTSLVSVTCVIRDSWRILLGYRSKQGK